MEAANSTAATTATTIMTPVKLKTPTKTSATWTSLVAASATSMIIGVNDCCTTRRAYYTRVRQGHGA